MRPLTIVALALALSGVALAQTSTNFKLGEHAFNAGGRPDGGTVATSASFKVSLDSVGEGLLGAAPSSSSFEIASGFGAAYPPPGEVGGLRFLNKTTLEWSPDGSAGSYNLYRNLQSALPGSGSCLLQDMTAATTTDGNTPPAGDGYAYLVTVANRLGEEGSKGLRSDGMERGGAACP